MSTVYLGQIEPFSFNFAPKGWAACNGQILPINQYQALFSLLGTTYGGNGQTTFALPNIQGNMCLGYNGTYPQGSIGGEASHTLQTSEIALHSHTAVATSAAATAGSPVNNFPAPLTNAFFSSAPDTPVNLGPGSSPNSGGQPHENRPPFLVLNFCIALQGIFPSRS